MSFANLEIYVIACSEDWNKVYQDKFYIDEREAYKVYDAMIDELKRSFAIYSIWTKGSVSQPIVFTYTESE